MPETLEHFKTMANAAAEALRSMETTDIYLGAVQAAWRLSESPIEKDMAQALICCLDINGGESPRIITPGRALRGQEPLIIAPQYRIGEYRADFAILSNITGRRLVVECDGHEFHDRTAEQAAYDKGRDRRILSRGFPVMRFTGAEVFRQIDLCISDISAYLVGDFDG